MKSVYETLGVSPDASDEDINAAFKKRSLKAHPDRGGDKAEFQAINEALMVLTDPDRRRRFDETGEVEVKAMQQRAEALLAAMVVEASSVDDSEFMVVIRKRIEHETRALNDRGRSLKGAIEKQQKKIDRFYESNKDSVNKVGRFVALTALTRIRESLETDTKAIDDRIKLLAAVKDLTLGLRYELPAHASDGSWPPSAHQLLTSRFA